MCSLRSLKPHVRTQKEEARQRELGRAKELEAKILGKQKRADELKAMQLSKEETQAVIKREMQRERRSLSEASKLKFHSRIDNVQVSV
jgi:hypothetical protein